MFGSFKYFTYLYIGIKTYTMTQEQILQGNKLIAEFMGATNGSSFCPIDENHLNLDYDLFRVSRIRDDGSMWDISDLLYNSSWDWLMPVVDKIKKIKGTWYYGISFHIQNDCCWFGIDNRKDKELNEHIHDELLSSIYEAVIEFIEWYNTNTK